MISCKEIRDNETVHYYNKHGLFHREDGPAIEDRTGYKAWFINGTFHRTDGPAVEWANGNKAWHINGELLTEEQFKRLTSKLGKILYL